MKTQFILIEVVRKDESPCEKTRGTCEKRETESIEQTASKKWEEWLNETTTSHFLHTMCLSA